MPRRRLRRRRRRRRVRSPRGTGFCGSLGRIVRRRRVLSCADKRAFLLMPPAEKLSVLLEKRDGLVNELERCALSCQFARRRRH